MKTMKGAAKDIIIAGLGTVDERNDDIKDLLRRGGSVFGIENVDNEELTYNGNRAELQAKREAQAREDHTYGIGPLEVSIYKDDEKTKEGADDEQT